MSLRLRSASVPNHKIMILSILRAKLGCYNLVSEPNSETIKTANLLNARCMLCMLYGMVWLLYYCVFMLWKCYVMVPPMSRSTTSSACMFCFKCAWLFWLYVFTRSHMLGLDRGHPLCLRPSSLGGSRDKSEKIFNKNSYDKKRFIYAPDSHYRQTSKRWNHISIDQTV